MHKKDPYDGADPTNGRGASWNGDARNVVVESEGNASLGELLKRLSTDTGSLISQEVTLAKAELKESASTALQGMAKLGMAVALALVGAIALNAFAIIGLGDLLGDNYWLSALIVGVIELGAGGMLAKNAMSVMKSGDLKPKETMESLSEDKAWAGREASDFKRDMRSSPTSPHART